MFPDVNDVFLLSEIIPRLQNIKIGCVAGFTNNGVSYAFILTHCTEGLLKGLEIVGFYFKNEALFHQHISEICEKLKISKDVVILIQSTDIASNELCAKILKADRTLTDINVKIVPHIPPVMLLRVKGSFPLFYEISSDEDKLKVNIASGVQKVGNLFKDNRAIFNMKESSFLILSDSDINVTCSNLHQFYANEEMSSNFIQNSKKELKKQIPVEFEILSKMLIEPTRGKGALNLRIERREFEYVYHTLHLDVLIICQQSTTVPIIYKMFTEGIQEQVEKIQEWMLNYAKKEPPEFITPVPYHFHPYLWSSPLTLIYPYEKTDEDLEKFRREIQEALLLPLDRPFLRKVNKCDFNSNSLYLINPHEGVPPSGVKEGNAAVVHGKYSYHHYLQDHINDDGWGCAYRSLQTIISWFKFQGYTDLAIPTHAEIQQALVDLKDKSDDFVGSKKWIGSQEVGFCLNHLLKVNYKILFAREGSAVQNFSRELYLHFKEKGTPVMIGGGNLAHTILGIDFNEKSGEVKFLVLDPHYKGDEDLRTILKKGYCGWKDSSFWSQNVFYNLCLPLPPKIV